MPSSSVRRGEWYTYSFSACLSSDRSTRLSVGRPILSRVCLGTTLVTRRGDGGGDSTVDDLGTAAVLIFAAFFFAFFSLFSSFPLFCGAAAFFLAGVLLRARFSFFLAGILLRAARALPDRVDVAADLAEARAAAGDPTGAARLLEHAIAAVRDRQANRHASKEGGKEGSKQASEEASKQASKQVQAR